MTVPNVGITDVAVMDPALGPDANSALAVGMIYTGLVKRDAHLRVLPDQALWKLSSDNKVYTFTLKPEITFSDGTPVTAQSYVYSWTRALLPHVGSSTSPFFEAAIVGANDVTTGKAKTLAGVQALDEHTLQVRLNQPTPYFLTELTTPLFFPVNQKIVEQANQKSGVETGIGTGPFLVKEWIHNVKMVFVPNPHYYGAKTRLTEVDMLFINDPSTAFKTYRAGAYSLVWNLNAGDQVAAQGLAGFVRVPLLQTDAVYFDNAPPFNTLAVRQAFAYAIDRSTLAHAVLHDAVVPAATILPPGIPDYQLNYAGLPFDSAQAKSLLQSVYPDVTKMPTVTFSYPSALVTDQEAVALQNMWQSALGILVQLRPMELTAYNDEQQRHLVQIGFTQWEADFPDPYDGLTLNLLSTANGNDGHWKNAQFDQLVTKAETASGSTRMALYAQAEKIAITDVGWLPLDHEALAAVIPPWVHGVTVNGGGLFFGDWSDVYLLQH